MTSETDLLPCVEIDPPAGAKASVIWLHGLGADGHDFEPIVPHLGITAEAGVRFVFPHAPAIPVTLNMGMVMPAWYDITELDLKKKHDEAGIRLAASRVEALIARERESGIPSERIVLAGFSQGGAIAIHTALRHDQPLAGLLALSSYLVLPEALEAERSEANLRLPIFQGHGTLDPMVPVERGKESHEFLVKLGYAAEWQTWPMQHEVCLEEIEMVGRWLAARLG